MKMYHEGTCIDSVAVYAEGFNFDQARSLTTTSMVIILQRNKIEVLSRILTQIVSWRWRTGEATTANRI